MNKHITHDEGLDAVDNDHQHSRQQPTGDQRPPMLIRTHFDPKPIPDRRFDWSATYDDYDADCDQDGFFSHDPVGYGRTEAEAVLDLITNSYRGVECSP